MDRKVHTFYFRLCAKGLSVAGFCLLLACLAALSGCTLPGGKRDASLSGGSAAGSAISRTALSAVGTRYTYGGDAPSTGFDCSGLVCWSYGTNGVRLPRTAREQSGMGRSVSKSALKPGDLVVFRTNSGMHTGIYTGKGKFVHSPGTGKRVRVDSIHDEYWRKRFVAGRRHTGVY